MSELTEFVFPSIDYSDTGENLLWISSERKRTFHSPIFDVEMIHRKAPDGREGDFVGILSRDWVTMLPLFVGKDGIPRFIMERQFRHGAEKVTIEFPAGLIEEGEKPEEAARRELLEETGLVCGKCSLIGSVNPNSAFMSNRSNFFLMEELSVTSGQNLDPNEQIDVLSIPVDQVIARMGSGMFDNGMMMLALGFYLRQRLNNV